MPTKQTKIKIPNCSECHIIHEYQWSCHFIRLILCDEHYGKVNIDKVLTGETNGAIVVKAKKVKKHNKHKS